MRTIAVVNQKGGSGKTTTAVNIAAALAERGEHVLLVDLDAQGSASAWLGTCQLDDRLLDVFIADATHAELARDTAWPRLSLVAASANLRDLGVAHAVDVHHALRRALPPPGRFDRVVLDCPPALGHIVIASLAAADMALVPVAAHAMELDGLAAAHSTITTVRQRINPDLALRVLACQVDHRTRLAGEVVATLRDRLDRPCSPRSSERTSASPKHPATASRCSAMPRAAPEHRTTEPPRRSWSRCGPMPDQRRLGRDPLEELLAAVTPGGAATDNSHQPPAPRRRGSARITAQVDPDLAEQVRDAVMWLHKVDVHTTISAIAEAGLRAELQRLAEVYRDGKRFPSRSGEVPTGRPSSEVPREP